MATDAIDLHNIPIKALKTSTRQEISRLLNPLKVIPSEEGFPRDWRGLAQLVGLHGELVPLISTKDDPTAQVFSYWKQGTLGHLQSFLGQLDRWDVVDDTAHMLEQDAVEFEKRKGEASEPAAEMDVEIDKQILTIADVHRLEQGLEPQHYDGFLLFADEDQDFAVQIVNKMEQEYHLKLCLKERDLVGGLAFEHEAIMRLIAKRCNRLIVIISPSFLKSEANKFFVTFATALGIDQRSRKIVPIVYKRCDELPQELKFYFLLDYSRAGTLWNFWTKLHNSIQSSSPAPNGHYIRSVRAIPSGTETNHAPRAIEYKHSTSVQAEEKETPSVTSLMSVSIEPLTTHSSLDTRGQKSDTGALKKSKSLSMESLRAKIPNKLKKYFSSCKRKTAVAECS